MSRQVKFILVIAHYGGLVADHVVLIDAKVLELRVGYPDGKMGEVAGIVTWGGAAGRGDGRHVDDRLYDDDDGRGLRD